MKRTIGIWCLWLTVGVTLAACFDRWPLPSFVSLALYVLRDHLTPVRPS